jgi:integrase
MILIAFRHGLRASELCGLQWSDIEFETAIASARVGHVGKIKKRPHVYRRPEP